MTDVAFIPDFLELDTVLIRIGDRYKYTWMHYTKQELIDIINQNCTDYKVRNKALQDLELIDESVCTDFIDVHAYRNVALRWSAAFGYLDVVKYLVEQGGDIHANNNYALRLASNNGHLNVVKYLVENGADISAKNYQALEWAKESMYTKVAEYLESIINKK